MDIARLVWGLPRPLRRHKLVRALLLLSPSSRIQQVRFNGGARVLADVSDPFPRSYLLAGGFDPEFFAIAAPFLRAGGAFLDVGANFGFCSFGLVHALAGAAPVDYHLFEANARICGILGRTAALHPRERITITHGCVTSAPGTSRLHVVENHTGASYITADGEQSVPNVVLDEYLDARGLDRVGLMKIDIEGLEPPALRGAARGLRDGRIRAVFVEVSTGLLARQGYTVADTFEPFTDAGFAVYYVREADLHQVRRDSIVEIAVHGTRLRLAPVTAGAFPAARQTDLLALHPAVVSASADSKGT